VTEQDFLPALTHPLAYVRSVRGWSAATLLRVIADTASDDFGIALSSSDRSKVYRWERLGVVPEPLAQRALARALDVAEERLVAEPWPRWLPAFDGMEPAPEWSATAALDAVAGAVSGGLTDRRGFLGITGPALVTLAEDWLRVEPARLVGALDGRFAVDEEIVASIERQTLVLRRLDDRFGGPTLSSTAAAQLRLVVDLLRDGAYSEAVGQRLFGAAASLGQFAGWRAYDAGQHFATQRFYRAGLQAAHAAHDVSLGAYLVASLGYQALELGHGVEARTLAEAAVEGARRSPSTRARALLCGYLALAYAATGDRSGAARAIDEAGALAQRPSSDDPSWAYWFDESYLTAFAARSNLLLGDGRRAAPGFTAFLATLDDGYVRERTVQLIWLAEALFISGEVDRACEAAGRAGDSAAAVASHRAHGKLHELAARITFAHSSASPVHDLQERLRAVRQLR